ncbi:hypothetical protein IFM89_036961 [Coptis chinensis]|uniref:Small ribosomal subunit protein mS35 mitochondrial conserved domain-containing protein n=1 Tax=Coptis chinensis TaxID=261450 RepID=A0A835HJC8_9MAGN|nr:hypothetical protein IFM89_036961 [Coptis chinensis]
MIEKYVKGENDEDLPAIVQAVFKRRFVGDHGDTDDVPLEEGDPSDEEIEDDFEELCSTDEDIDDLYNARDYVMKKLVKDKYFNMDDEKWKELLQDAVNNGAFKVTKECEDILEDMEHWDKLLPDEIKKKVEEKYNELGDMCDRGEIEPEAAYKLFKEFEDQLVQECMEITAAEKSPEEYETSGPDKKLESDDPPGEGPILRWQQRVVFGPGGDAWHPKNRKVKLSVTVKELGLSKHAFRRLRELVGKRYNPGKDELTITSERFEHREENRKDCMRTLLSLIEEAAKARKLVEDTRTSYHKERLKANPAFMERLHAKTRKTNSSQSAEKLL